MENNEKEINFEDKLLTNGEKVQMVISLPEEGIEDIAKKEAEALYPLDKKAAEQYIKERVVGSMKILYSSYSEIS